MTTLPKEVHRYMTMEDGHVLWSGVKFYGRPVWKLWLQRAVWEDANGEIPRKATVGETCGHIGCLSLDHLKLNTQKKRVLVTHCRHCRSVLSRDKNHKTYCPLCMRNKARDRREERRVI